MDRLLNVMTGLSVALILLVLSRSDWVLQKIARTLGITDPPLALVLIIGCLFLIVFYRFSVIISDLKDANISLAQRVAILEYHLRSSHEKQEAQPTR